VPDDGLVTLPVGLATSIGSLPHCDPGDAVDFVLRHQLGLPAAPSLPARSRAEGMVAQAACGVRGVELRADGSLAVDPTALDPDAGLVDPGFASDSFVGLRAFLTAVADRRGPIKVSLTGPVTFGMALHAAGVPADRAFEVAAAAVDERAAALVDYVAARVPQAQLVVFVDEPSLTRAMDPSFPISPTEAIDRVSGTLAVLERAAITGLHCCGPADWRLLLQAGAQILSLPADAGIETSSGAAAAYLERGGWFAWGAVPTDRPIGTTVDRLWRQLSGVWCEMVTAGGCDPARLRTQAMITPACGLYRHGVPQAEQVLTFTNRLADRLHDQAIGVRLSVGA
jgi:hypothetical protein